MKLKTDTFPVFSSFHLFFFSFSYFANKQTKTNNIQKQHSFAWHYLSIIIFVI